ncbi:MAG: hypothetical protein KDA85_08145, partial [Planctomycetaceae bacterium]|nr:hypothetical protein [Planctomycetaceae bacterium]
HRERELTSRDRQNPEFRSGLQSSHYRGNLTNVGQHNHLHPSGSTISRNSVLANSGTRIQLSLNSGPAAPGLPAAPAPWAIGGMNPTPYNPPLGAPAIGLIPPPTYSLNTMYQPGQIVDAPVPLAPFVRIEDPQNIAPNAIPIVVAVRTPGLCDHACDCCTESVVFVQVMAPPCPVRKLKVSPCRTRVDLDFGTYEITITSTAGVITVDYSD